MEIVTGYVGRPHVTAEQDRAQNQGVFGVESYVLNVGQKMAAELQSNNEIRIRDGVLVHQGCTGVVKTGTYDPVTITNGTQGMKRIDLIVARYTKNAETNVENLAWKVIQGTPAASNPAIPSYIEGDIQAGDLISDMPMYEIHLDGITVSEVKAVFTALKTGAEMQADISSLNSNFDIFANGGENSDGKALRIDTAIMQGKNLLYECWGPSFFPYGSNTTGAPTAWPGLMLAFTLPYGSEGWTRQVKISFELSGDIYYMTYKNGIIDKNWTKIAGPA